MANKPQIDANKIVVFSGSGISAESGLSIFRGDDGLWDQYPVELIATPTGWKHDPGYVLEFYNKLRKKVEQTKPNPAHNAITELQKKYKVVVITQNIDDLHERAGSTNVIHLHGEITKSCSSIDTSLIHENKYDDIELGMKSSDGSQLRPYVVWFGESPLYFQLAKNHIETAGKFLVVGTSLKVEPATSLVNKGRFNSEKIFIDLKPEKKPPGFKLLRGRASNLVPSVCKEWLK